MEFHPIPTEGRPSPSTLKVKDSNDPYADQEARWKLIEEHILRTLAGEPMDSSRYMAAFTAVYDLETSSGKGAISVMYDVQRRTRKHGLRIRLIKLLLAYRESYRSTETLSDQEFLERWAKAAKALEFHNRQFVKRHRDEQGKYFVEDEMFPDDGRTTVFELGRRVWFDETEIKLETEDTI